MNYRSTPAALAAAALLLVAGLSPAAEGDHWTGYAQGAAPPAAKNTQPAKRKAAANIKLVDINSANKEQLKKLPGIGDAEADKIIAGRPYGSKAWLVTRKIIPEDLYPGLKGLIIAKQPFKDGAQNAAIYSKKP